MGRGYRKFAVRYSLFAFRQRGQVEALGHCAVKSDATEMASATEPRAEATV
jgi:hypothetical protein